MLERQSDTPSKLHQMYHMILFIYIYTQGWPAICYTIPGYSVAAKEMYKLELDNSRL